jgi:hypothetical protein
MLVWWCWCVNNESFDVPTLKFSLNCEAVMVHGRLLSQFRVRTCCHPFPVRDTFWRTSTSRLHRFQIDRPRRFGRNREHGSYVGGLGL